MIRALELIGFILIGGTVYAYLGLIAQGDPLGGTVFWGCAGGALAIIICRKIMRKRKSDPDRRQSADL